MQDWLPLHVGDRWIYECKVLDGNKMHPRVGAWQQAEIVTVIGATADGVIVKRSIRFLHNSKPPRYLPPMALESNITVRKNCIYLSDSEAGPNSKLPDVCFPLSIGQTWGDASQGRDFWKVAGLGRTQADDPPSVTGNAWRLEAHLSSGDDNYVWFQKGVGIVARRTLHNGTYDDWQMRLIRFVASGK